MIYVLLLSSCLFVVLQDGAAPAGTDASAVAPSAQAPSAAATDSAAADGNAAASPASSADAAPVGNAAPADATGSTPAKAPAKQPEQTFGIQQLFPFLIMGLLFYMMLIRPQQKEHRRRQELLNALKKNDRVVTSAGIIGTVADISADGKIVTVKVDDSTRIKFQRSAIQGLQEEKSESAAS